MVITNIENWLISVFIQCSCSNIPVDREKHWNCNNQKNMKRIKKCQRYLHRASLHDARHDDDDDNDVHACVHLHIVTLFRIFTLTSFSCKLSQNCPSSACPRTAVLVAPVPVPLSQFRMSQNRVSQVQQFAYYWRHLKDPDPLMGNWLLLGKQHKGKQDIKVADDLLPVPWVQEMARSVESDRQVWSHGGHLFEQPPILQQPVNW